MQSGNHQISTSRVEKQHSAIKVATICQQEVTAIQQIHEAVFPSSDVMDLGPSLLERYLSWVMAGDQAFGAIGAYANSSLVGYCIAVYGDPVWGFIRTNFLNVVGALLKHPRSFVATALRRAIGKLRRRQWAKAEPAVNIIYLAVHPEFRGRKIGAVLLESIQSLARTNGIAEMWLNVDPRNHYAIRLYGIHGWEKHLVHGAWNGCMRKRL